MHLVIFYMDLPICYICRLRGHIHRNYRSSRHGAGRGTAHPASSAATTSVIPPPTQGTQIPAGLGGARGGAQSWGGSDHFFAIRGRQNSEASPDVVIGILTVQSQMCMILLI